MNKPLAILILVFIAAFLLDVMFGSVLIPFEGLWNILLGEPVDHPAWERIVVNYRLPRAVTGVLAGSGLGLSGLYMQTFFRNPLAGPYVLGISAGASLGVALVVFGESLWLLFGIQFMSGFSMAIGAIIGSFLVFAVVLFFSTKVRDNTSLLIIGLMFSSATSAIVSILQFFSNPEDVQSYLIWTFGDLGSVTLSELQVLFPLIALGWVGSVFLIKPLNIFLLGNQYAKNAGLNMTLAKYGVISVTALLSGTITAYCGPIAFIGLATPHIARMILDTSDHRLLIPFVGFLGAIILMLCDVISRMPGLSHSLPLNAITSILGGPLVIWLIVKRGNISNSF
ncbi:iron chelate uptake ABC transporter family permease subunit [Reichenbachiella sp.]|uniref:iron chelate uptake ABC transporter family permease subunit n=1 Tax=Reichenbachiella sp. TaxID=2184521 RepID=UPI003B5AFB4B